MKTFLQANEKLWNFQKYITAFCSLMYLFWPREVVRLRKDQMPKHCKSWNKRYHTMQQTWSGMQVIKPMSSSVTAIVEDLESK